ncbi:MAG: hypothetical protein ACPL7O_01235 [Armatimonadota bacterium]
MFRVFVLLVIASLLCGVLSTLAVADRLILIPTGKTLSTGSIKAEYAANSDGDGKIYWVNLGVSRLEVEGARFQDFTPDTEDALSAQVSVLPETTFTPAIGVGMRDIGDETNDKGVPYDGQSLYLAVSKTIPVTGGVPLLFQDVVLHGGIGTNALSGVFFGVEGTLPMGIRVMGEYDTNDFNFALSYNLIPTLNARLSSIKGDIYYGALFSVSF